MEDSTKVGNNLFRSAPVINELTPTAPKIRERLALSLPSAKAVNIEARLASIEIAAELALLAWSRKKTWSNVRNSELKHQNVT